MPTIDLGAQDQQLNQTELPQSSEMPAMPAMDVVANAHWHVCYTKPRQEFRAQENLVAQGFEVFLPTILAERILRKQLIKRTEPLFARYCFVRGDTNANWALLRSTKGVSHLLRFGSNLEPATVPTSLVEQLLQMCEEKPAKKVLFRPGQAVRIGSGPFKGMDGFFDQMHTAANGEERALVLLELLSKTHSIGVPAHALLAN
jgi:transcriptional antiterminator RfaH